MANHESQKTREEEELTPEQAQIQRELESLKTLDGTSVSQESEKEPDKKKKQRRKLKVSSTTEEDSPFVTRARIESEPEANVVLEEEGKDEVEEVRPEESTAKDKAQAARQEYMDKLYKDDPDAYWKEVIAERTKSTLPEASAEKGETLDAKGNLEAARDAKRQVDETSKVAEREMPPKERSWYRTTQETTTTALKGVVSGGARWAGLAAGAIGLSLVIGCGGNEARKAEAEAAKEQAITKRAQLEKDILDRQQANLADANAKHAERQRVAAAEKATKDAKEGEVEKVAKAAADDVEFQAGLAKDAADKAEDTNKTKTSEQAQVEIDKAEDAYAAARRFAAKVEGNAVQSARAAADLERARLNVNRAKNALIPLVKAEKEEATKELPGLRTKLLAAERKVLMERAKVPMDRRDKLLVRLKRIREIDLDLRYHLLGQKNLSGITGQEILDKEEELKEADKKLELEDGKRHVKSAAEYRRIVREAVREKADREAEKLRVERAGLVKGLPALGQGFEDDFERLRTAEEELLTLQEEAAKTLQKARRPIPARAR